METFEMMSYLKTKRTEIQDYIKDLNEAAKYRPRWDKTINARREYLSIRLDLIEEIMEDLDIPVTTYPIEEAADE